MSTKTLKASSLALVAFATFATVASTPASAKGGGGHGPVLTNFGGGVHLPVHGPGSSHNPIIYRGHPWIPIFPIGGPNKGGPKMGQPTRGWGGPRGYGMGRGYGVGVGYSGVTTCPVHFHWSPKFLRCIPNYV